MNCFKKYIFDKNMLWLWLILLGCTQINPLSAMDSTFCDTTKRRPSPITDDQNIPTQQRTITPTTPTALPTAPYLSDFRTPPPPVRTASTNGLHGTPITFIVPDKYATPTKKLVLQSPQKTLTHTSQYHSWRHETFAKKLAKEREKKILKHQEKAPITPDIIRAHLIPETFDTLLKVEKRAQNKCGEIQEDGTTKLTYPNSEMIVQVTPLKEIHTPGTLEICVSATKNHIFHDVLIGNEGQKTFQCKPCTISFGTESDCDEHIRLKHSTPKIEETINISQQKRLFIPRSVVLKPQKIDLNLLRTKALAALATPARKKKSLDCALLKEKMSTLTLPNILESIVDENGSPIENERNPYCEACEHRFESATAFDSHKQTCDLTTIALDRLKRPAQEDEEHDYCHKRGRYYVMDTR